MANFIAWIGIGAGILVGMVLVSLWMRNRKAGRGSELEKTTSGLYLKGSEFESLNPSHSLGPKDEPVQNIDTTEPSETQQAPTEGEAPSKAASKSLSDRLSLAKGIQGNLTQVPVHDFLQFLAQGKRTGILEVISGRRHGYIKMAEGQIEHAVFRGRTGLAALFALLPLKEGDFEFLEGPQAALPSHAEVGEIHGPLDVLDVLFQWEAKMKKTSLSDSPTGEA